MLEELALVCLSLKRKREAASAGTMGKIETEVIAEDDADSVTQFGAGQFRSQIRSSPNRN
jgi:hypothetical protein